MTSIVRVLLCGALAALLAAAAHAADPQAGRGLFDTHCQSCHGPEGNGDGPAAAEFVLRPRPFSQAAFKFDTDADWQTGTDADLATVIREGAAAYGGSSFMPPWPGLADSEIADLVAYVRSLGPSVADPARAAEAGFAPVYAILERHCGACHVRGQADGPFSLDTPPSAERFPECIEARDPVRCATYHELVDAPDAQIPAWIRPEDASSSEPYVQACVADGSFHIGHSLPAALPDRECATLLDWIASGAAY